MDDVYECLYQMYSESFVNHAWNGSAWIPIPAVAICNHKQIDKILKALRDDEEDEGLILDAMRSCVGCIGDSVPALED